MRFALSDEQHAFASALDDLLSGSDVPAANRAWAEGDHGPGLALWSRLAELGVTALDVPEETGGLGGTTLDLAVAFEQLGRHGVPGPWIESVAVAPALLAATGGEDVLAGLADGSARVTLAAPPTTPYAVDCAAATTLLLVTDEGVARAEAGRAFDSVDPTRTLCELRPTGEPTVVSSDVLGAALDRGSLACAAYLLGCGERMLAETVGYVGQRRQFGRVIGEYQALKHALADVRVALDFTRPLVHGAAVQLDGGSGTAARGISAAKVAASDAAHLASRTGLQAHGAIGYTLEYDLSIWMLRTRALVGAWGTPSQHRARVLRKLARS